MKKNMETNEYQFDFSKTSVYVLKVYKRHTSGLHFTKKLVFKEASEVIKFIGKFPLSPSCFIEGMLFEFNPYIHEDDLSILNFIENKKQVRKIEICSKSGV